MRRPIADMIGRHDRPTPTRSPRFFADAIVMLEAGALASVFADASAMLEAMRSPTSRPKADADTLGQR